MIEHGNPAPLPDADGHNPSPQPERLFPEGSLGQRAYDAAKVIFANHPHASFTGRFHGDTHSGSRLFVVVHQDAGDTSILIRRVLMDDKREGPETLLAVKHGIPEMMTEDYDEDGSVVEDPAEALLFLGRVAIDLRGIGRLRKGTLLPTTATTEAEVAAAAQTIANTIRYDRTEQDINWRDPVTHDSYSATAETRRDGAETRTVLEFRRISDGVATIDGISEDGATTAVQTTDVWVFTDQEPEGRYASSREIVEQDEPMDDARYQKAYMFNVAEVKKREARLRGKVEALPGDTDAKNRVVTYFEEKATEIRQAREDGTLVALPGIDYSKDQDAPLLLEDSDLVFSGLSSSGDSFPAPSREEPDDPHFQFPDDPYDLEDL